MKLKNVTLAAALLAVLTGCGSNGSGNNNATPNSEVHNNQATQAQLAKQRAELEQLKLQLAQAQQEVENAKTAKQHAEKILEEKQQAVSEAQTALKNAGDRVTAAKKTLETLQTNPQMATQADFNQKLTEAQKALNEANAAKQAVEKQLTDRNNEIINIQKNLTASNDKLAKATQGLNDAQDKIVKAEQEKQALQAKLDQAAQAQSTAEKAYNATLKGRDEALNQIRADLEAKQKELATKEQALTDAKQQLATAQETAKQDEASKAILEEQLKEANTNLEIAKKTKANTEKAFQQQLASKDNELVKARENLTASNDKLAKAEQELKAAQASIQAGNANKIALENQLNEAKQNLEVAKQAKDEAEKTLKAQVAKKDQLLNNAQNEKVQAQNYEYENNLDDIKRKNFLNLAKERFGNGFDYTELIDKNLSFPIEKFKKLLSFVDMVKPTSDSKYGVDRGIIKFAKNFIDLDEVAFKNKLNKRLEFKNLVEKYPNAYGEYVSHDEFLTENFEKTLDEKLLILSSNLKGRGKYYYKEIDGFYPQGELIQTEMVKNSNSYTVSERNHKIYNQKYSVVISDYEKTTENGFSPDVRESFITWNRGLPTLESALPIEGKATYSGKAFNHESNGNFTYTVNFKDKKGSGHITDIPNYGNINLEEASIKVKQPSKQPGIVGDASFNRNEQEVTGKYELNFYGPNAEEVAGNVIFNSYNGKDLGVGRGMYRNSFSNNETEIGFGGSRGEITK